MLAAVMAAVLGGVPTDTARTAPLAPLQACATPGWHHITSVGGSISTLAGDPALEHIFAATIDGTGATAESLWRGAVTSTDWQAVPDLTGLGVSDVLVTPALTTTVWASTFGSQGVFGSTDGGATFSRRGAAGDRYWMSALAGRDGTVYAANSLRQGRGVYRWSNGEAGGAWTRLGGDEIETLKIHDLVAPSGSSQLLAATDRAGLWRSTDDGGTWAPVAPAELGTTSVWSVAVDPSNTSHLLLGLGPHVDTGATEPKPPLGLLRSTDGGLTWAAAGPAQLSSVAVTEVAFGTTTAGTAYATTWGHGLWASSDAGATWRRLPGPSEQPSHYEALLLLAPPSVPGCELVLLGGRGTTDGSGVWARNLADIELDELYLPVVAFDIAVR